VRARIGAAALLAVLAPHIASAQQGTAPLKIGFLTDMHAGAASDDGPGAIDGARMAIEDLGSRVLGRPVELVVGDHQLKVDIGLSIARRWLDVDGVDAIMDVNNSAIALGVQELTREKGKPFLITGAASEDLTGKACSPLAVQWLPDTYSLGRGAALAFAERGVTSWYFVSVDYTYGHLLEEAASRTVTAQGGKVLGHVRFPLGTEDYSSFLLQAQASGAQALGLSSSAHDTMTAIKQAREFGVGMQLVPMNAFLMDVHGVGLDTMKGVRLIDVAYWDMDDKTRAWAKRYIARNGHMPTSMQTDAYRAVYHYMRAIDAAKTTEGLPVVRKMKEMPVDDPLGSGASIREDGRVMLDLYLFQVKSPSESRYPWDYYELLSTVPADQAYRPLADSACPLIKH
jgi:branched-chain amino acid transport system substrate-binding protein